MKLHSFKVILSVLLLASLLFLGPVADAAPKNNPNAKKATLFCGDIIALSGHPALINIIRIAQKPMGISKWVKVLDEATKLPEEESIFSRISQVLSLDIHTNNEGMERIPQKGPAIIAANHPSGIADGIILGDVLAKAGRKDVKIVQNGAGQLRGYEDNFIYIDFDGSNTKAIREMKSWLDEGHVLVIFPAGSVSAFQNGVRKLRDPEWQSAFISTASNSGAPIIPTFLDLGYAPWELYNRFPLTHSLMVPSVAQMALSQERRSANVHFGAPIDPNQVMQQFSEAPSRKEQRNRASNAVREAVYQLEADAKQ